MLVAVFALSKFVKCDDRQCNRVLLTLALAAVFVGAQRLWLERRRITEMTRMDCDEMLTEKEDGDE